MNARTGVLLLVVALAFALIAASREHRGDARATGSSAHTGPSEPSATTRVASAAAPMPAPAATAGSSARGVSGVPGTTAPPVAADAASALALTLRDGDPRSPPIAPREPVDDDQPPTTNELVDPAAYRRYEARRQARVYRAFEREASIALIDLQRDIDRARTTGVPAEQIAEGEEKARMLAETLRRVRDGEIGAND